MFEKKLISIHLNSNRPSSFNNFIKSLITTTNNIDVIEVLVNIDTNDKKMIDQEKIDLVARMGGDWYCRTDSKSMFEIKKPISTKGIGFDQVPKEILNSTILSGNDLGRLGGIEALPDETDVNEFRLMELSELFLEFENNPKALEIALHKKAKYFLSKNQLEAAWKTLLSFNN